MTKTSSQATSKILYCLTWCSVLQQGAVRFHFPYVIREETVWIFSYSSMPQKRGTAWPDIHSPEMKSNSQEAIRFKVFRDSAGQRQQAMGQKEHSHSDKAKQDSVSKNPGISAFCSSNADRWRAGVMLVTLKPWFKEHRQLKTCNADGCHPLQVVILGHWCRQHGR